MKFLIYLKKEKEKYFSELEIPMEYSQYSSYLTVEVIRNKFENFLEIWGLDFNLSQKIWNLYMNFESDNLKYLKEKDSKEKNYEENIKIFHMSKEK